MRQPTRLIALGGLGFVLLLALTAVQARTFGALAGDRSPTVVELYTSQGCSSCPPADALLGKLAKRGDIIALSFHVDYWDYIGWKDPFAHASYSKRQRTYARHFSRSFVYTPQMVVHGLTETSGTDEREVHSRIARAANAPDVTVGLTHGYDGEISVSVSASTQPAQASVWLVLYQSSKKTEVRRGENRGRVIENFNIVKKLAKIGEWKGQRLNLTVSADKFRERGVDGCAVFLQSEQTGPILGAARIALADHK